MTDELTPAAGTHDVDTNGGDPGRTVSALDRGLRVRKLLLLGPGTPFVVDFTRPASTVPGAPERHGTPEYGEVLAPNDTPSHDTPAPDTPDAGQTGHSYLSQVPAGDAPSDGSVAASDVWPLSVIAGRTNTGKTSVLRFIEYVLGAKDFPAHAEVLRQVQSAALEVQTPDGLFTIERVLEANRVRVYPGPSTSRDPLAATTLVVEPTSDPESISQFVLTSVGLQDVELREAPTKSESGTDRMSFRDLLWLCLYFNERVGSQQLLHTGNVMKQLKLRQVVDAVFGVHDNEGADLARRIRDSAASLDAQRRSLEQLREFVTQQQPRGALQLATDADELDAELRRVDGQIHDLEARARAASDFASEMRTFHSGLAERATRSAARVRDRVSLLDRFGSLRAQYADDVRKLTMLVEAEYLFDQLSVQVCPACFSRLTEQPTLTAGVCSLCHTDTRAASTPEAGDETPASSSADGNSGEGASLAVEAVSKELRAARRRYKELDEYWQRLFGELDGLRQRADEDAVAEEDAATRLDAVTGDALSPYLAERTELGTRRQATLVQLAQVTQGIKLYTGLEARQAAFERAARHLEDLRKQQRDAKQRPDRDRVIADISTRYAHILRTIQYPKVDETGTMPPFIDSNLVPYVRGHHFKEASSGGQVLVTLAWALAVFETAYETHAAHPGVLMIDTPQKNLGGKADDAAFADIHLVERLYEHILTWLEGAGRGAQVIVVDNTPPANVEDCVRVRYTRDPANPPFGLIANEVGDTMRPGDDAESGDTGETPVSEGERSRRS